jgi:polysaccharide export outer membrane protein
MPSVRAWRALLCALAIAAGACGAAFAQSSDYQIGPHDVLGVTVWSQMDLSGKYTVEADGKLTFPLIGEITLAGLTVRQAENELRARLKDGFFQDPQLSISIQEYRSRRVFVVGQVRQPGSYPLDGETTLVELLAKAGSTLPDAASEALIVPGANSGHAVLPAEAGGVQVERVNIKQLQSGLVRDEPELHDGDTVFVPHAETVYVSGQVRTPGAYAVGATTTVLQAITLAGGATEFGATNRIQIIRVVNGKREELKARLDDLVKADDTIVVPERFF